MDVGTPVEEEPEWMRRHPDFQAVLCHFCDRLVAPLRRQRVMIKLFGQRAPTEIAAQIIMMHTTARSPSERPTVTRIQDRLPGTRRTAAFIALLRGFGIVQAERDPGDARIRYLVPGPILVDGLRDWLALHLSCHCRLAGGEDAGERLRTDRGFYDRVVRECASLLDPRNRPLLRHPDLAWLDEHDSGLYLALTLVERSLAQAATAGAGDDGGGWVEASAADLAALLGVSKSHIRNLINAMEARGLIRQDEHRHRLLPTDRFRQAVERWFCHQIDGIAQAARRAGRGAEDARPAAVLADQSSATFPVAMS
ncbi:helix-turn-helix domain-containing protein [Azospirillum sp. YIM B02556]|uniref:Helix-turn-helix domain-containing protein n=1 Tax=Azospirillum endophyticum TaxID=2800326 RepID=A0ABS1F6R2_9PROT|nr:helix-turn-helix domain-containing protein [Azospirillum endophyticum]MBK1839053.1 helix-turn-helix domain-containing protein [Azospirillum endophyticum]